MALEHRPVARSLVASARSSRSRPYRHVAMNELLASAKVSRTGNEDTATGGGASQAKAWQRQAWGFYDEVGEARYSARFIAACLSRCRLTVGLPDKRNKVGPTFDEKGEPLRDDTGVLLPGLEAAEEANRIVQALRNPVGGQAQMLSDMGLNISVAGEFHLVGKLPEGEDGAEPLNIEAVPVTALEWDVLSVDEFYPAGKKYAHKETPGAQPNEIDPKTVHVVRLWRSHPRFKTLPDSMFMSVREVLEELVLLTREVQAEALSRIANSKVFGVPDEIEWGGDEDEDDSGSDDGDPLTRDMLVKMSTAITDKASAAAVAPFILRGPGEYLKMCQVWDLSPDKASDSASKRAEAISRFAGGVDLPVEVVQGHMNTTFANAVVIDDSLFKSHIEPVLEIICDGLTAGFLRPALGDLGYDDSPLVVYYDSGELVSRPNRGQDAKDLHDRQALSDASLRVSCGFSDNDAPDLEEMQKRIAIKRAMNAKDTGEPVQLGDDTQDAIPGGETAPGSDVTQGADAALAASIEAMAEITVEQSVVRAGNRLRSHANRRNPSIRAQLAQVPAAEVPVTLGPTLVESFAGDEDLFYGQFDALWNLTVRRSGDQNYADALVEACKQLAGERLYQPRRPFPFNRLPRYSERAVLSAAS